MPGFLSFLECCRVCYFPLSSLHLLSRSVWCVVEFSSVNKRFEGLFMFTVNRSMPRKKKQTNFFLTILSLDEKFVLHLIC